MASFCEVIMTSSLPKIAANNIDELLVKNISLMTTFCNQCTVLIHGTVQQLLMTNDVIW